MPKRPKNLDDFQNDVLHINVSEYYDKGKFPTLKQVTLAFMGENCVYHIPKASAATHVCETTNWQRGANLCFRQRTGDKNSTVI
jgi:hypothetical protein